MPCTASPQRCWSARLSMPKRSRCSSKARSCLPCARIWLRPPTPEAMTCRRFSNRKAAGQTTPKARLHRRKLSAFHTKKGPPHRSGPVLLSSLENLISDAHTDAIWRQSGTFPIGPVVVFDIHSAKADLLGQLQVHASAEGDVSVSASAYSGAVVHI